MEKLNWIPDVIFRSSTIISPGVMYAHHESSTFFERRLYVTFSNAVESVVLDYVLPLPARADDLQAWVDRFIFVYASVSSPSQQNMLRLTRIAERRPTAYDGYLKACQDNNVRILIRPSIPNCHSLSPHIDRAASSTRTKKRRSAC